MTNQTLETLSACIRLSRHMMQTAARDEALTATEIVSCGALAKPWSMGKFEMGDICQHNGEVYRCCQAHDSNEHPDWAPDAVPALWTQYHTTDAKRATAYVAPTGAHDAYYVGECVAWEDAVYRCLVDGTVQSPEVLTASWKKQ